VTAPEPIPPRWRADRLLVEEAAHLSDARVVGDDDGFVVLAPHRSGLDVTGYGHDERPARIVADLVASGELAAPLGWMTMPRAADLPASVCAALHVTPLEPGWDWMSIDATPAPAATDGVVALDPARDAEAIRDCLAEANPTTEADPSGPREAGWWGSWRGDRLAGVIGAGRRDGPDGTPMRWHLHGLGVRPSVRTRGLGTALMVAATRAGFAAGAPWVSLGVWADNARAISIYRRLGYHTDHERRSYRPLP
jgi:ribosomal protein S18 acetylase RimI-like enzyme